MRKVSYRRYTDIPSLISMLTNRELTLLDPSFWDDKNDSYFLSTYKEKEQLKSVLALCFTTESETYHHWRVFSSGTSGVCINFRATDLEKTLNERQGVSFKKVNYLKIDELRSKQPRTEELPFLKRLPYKHEMEFRALWKSKTQEIGYLNIPFELSSVTRITLSPWMHPNLRKGVINLLKKIDDCKSIPMWGSTLIDNDEWKSFGDSAT